MDNNASDCAMLMTWHKHVQLNYFYLFFNFKWLFNSFFISLKEKYLDNLKNKPKYEKLKEHQHLRQEQT
jgi:hypothetical protein